MNDLDPEELDAKWRQSLVRFCYSYLRDIHAAEDAAQEVLHQASTIEEAPESLRAWLYTLARNRCLNLLRGEQRQPERERLATEPGLAESIAGPLTRLVNAEAAEDAVRLLDRLSSEQREALILRYTEDLDRNEIAAVLDEPVSVIKSRLYEGLQRLRELARA